jgi:hypothetical protein
MLRATRVSGFGRFSLIATLIIVIFIWKVLRIARKALIS